MDADSTGTSEQAPAEGCERLGALVRHQLAEASRKKGQVWTIAQVMLTANAS